MPYKNGAWIGVSRSFKEDLNRWREENEPWEDFLRAIFEGWYENNQKISHNKPSNN